MQYWFGVDDNKHYFVFMLRATTLRSTQG